jgi:hypothetical protein
LAIQKDEAMFFVLRTSSKPNAAAAHRQQQHIRCYGAVAKTMLAMQCNTARCNALL